MIYCVVPEPLADELYDKLANYYEDDPNVTVIVDRRKQERREAGGVRRDAQGDELSELADDDKVPNAAADDRGGLHLS